MDKDNVGADGVQSGSNGDLSMTSGPSLAGPVNSTTDGVAELEIPHGRSGSSVEPSPASRSAVQLNSQVANQPDIQHMDRFSNVAARAATVNSAFDVVHGSSTDIPVGLQVEPASDARNNSGSSSATNQISGVSPVSRPQPSNGNLVGQNFMSNGSVGRPVDSGDSSQQQILSSVQSFRSTVNPSLTQQINTQSPTQPVLAGTGDIVLSGASHKKNHKRLAIGLVLLFALVVVVGGGIITYSALFSQGAKEVRNYREAFNQYANYLLYQKDENSPLDSDTIWHSDVVVKELYSDDYEKNSFFSNLTELYYGFKERFYGDEEYYGALSSEQREFFDGSFSNINSSLELLRKLAVIKYITVDGMIDSFFSMGVTNMIEDVKNNYNDFIQSENTRENEYGSEKVALAVLVGDLYTKYDENGCVQDWQLDTECVDDISDVSVKGMEIKTSNISTMLRGMERDMANDLVTSSRMLYEIINSEENYNE